MTILEKLNAGILYLDGGMGTMLQAAGLQPGELPETWNLKHPDKVAAIHRADLEAGSNVVFSNTFGANRLKYDNVAEVVTAGVSIAKGEAVRHDGYVALDLLKHTVKGLLPERLYRRLHRKAVKTW